MPADDCRRVQRAVKGIPEAYKAGKLKKDDKAGGADKTPPAKQITPMISHAHEQLMTEVTIRRFGNWAASAGFDIMCPMIEAEDDPAQPTPHTQYAARTIRYSYHGTMGGRVACGREILVPWYCIPYMYSTVPYERPAAATQHNRYDTGGQGPREICRSGSRSRETVLRTSFTANARGSTFR